MLTIIVYKPINIDTLLNMNTYGLPTTVIFYNYDTIPRSFGTPFERFLKIDKIDTEDEIEILTYLTGLTSDQYVMLVNSDIPEDRVDKQITDEYLVYDDINDFGTYTFQRKTLKLSKVEELNGTSLFFKNSGNSFKDILDSIKNARPVGKD